MGRRDRRGLTPRISGTWLACLASIVLVVTACQAPVPPPVPSGGSAGVVESPTAGPTAAASGELTSPSGAPAFPTAPISTNQLDVSVKVDQSNATSAVMGPKGGSLSLTTADGTTFRLDIPANALVFDTEVGLTPVVSIDGWSERPKDLAAVQLEPDGQELMIAGSLTVTRKELAAEGSNAQVGYDGAGLGLHPILATLTPNGVVIPIRHFSGYGYIWRAEEESYWTAWTRYRHREAQKQFDADLALVVGLWRSKQMRGLETTDSATAVENFISRWYDELYQPRMAFAFNSCKDAHAAAETLLNFWRQLQIIGVDIGPIAQDFQAKRVTEGNPVQYAFSDWPAGFVSALVNICDTEALTACAHTGDFTRLLLYVRDRTEYFAKSGGPPTGVASGGYMLSLCGRYEFRMRGTFGWHLLDNTPGQPRYPSLESIKRFEVDFTVKMRWKPRSDEIPWFGSIEGEGTPTFTVQLDRSRQRNLIGTDSGTRDDGWLKWCLASVHFGTWGRWRAELKSLDFLRIGDDRVTRAFINAKVLLGSLDAGTEKITSRCGVSGSDSEGIEVLGPLVAGKPADIAWANNYVGITGAAIEHWTVDEYPVVCSREWHTNVPLPMDHGGSQTFDQDIRLEIVHTPAT